MAEFRPTYITFDCYGTLIDFHMSHMARTLFADRLEPDRLQAFTTDFSAYRFDEVLGGWKWIEQYLSGFRPKQTQ